MTDERAPPDNLIAKREGQYTCGTYYQKGKLYYGFDIVATQAGITARYATHGQFTDFQDQSELPVSWADILKHVPSTRDIDRHQIDTLAGLTIENADGKSGFATTIDKGDLVIIVRARPTV